MPRVRVKPHRGNGAGSGCRDGPDPPPGGPGDARFFDHEVETEHQVRVKGGDPLQVRLPAAADRRDAYDAVGQIGFLGRSLVDPNRGDAGRQGAFDGAAEGDETPRRNRHLGDVEAVLDRSGRIGRRCGDFPRRSSPAAANSGNEAGNPGANDQAPPRQVRTDMGSPGGPFPRVVGHAVASGVALSIDR